MIQTMFFGPEGKLRNGWKILLFLLSAGILTALINLGFRLAHLRGLPAWLPGPAFSAILTLALSWAFLRVEGRPFASMGFRINRRWGLEFLLGIGLGVALILITALLVLGVHGFQWVRNPAASASTLLAGAWLYLAVGFNEEGLFRGYIFQRMVDGMGPWPTQILLAVLFALAHWGNPGMSGTAKVWGSLNIALAAILLGLGYLRTRSLALPIGLHLGWNWTQGNLLGFHVSGTPASGFWTPVLANRPVWLNGGDFGLEATLACAVICTGFILLLVWWKPKTESMID